MASDIENYLQARIDFEKTRKKIELVADEILLVGNALRRDPSRFSFAGTDIDLPKGVFSGQTYPAADWCSARTIQQLLTNYHDARILLRESWSKIPNTLKSGLQPPPPGVLPPQDYKKREK